MRKTVRKNLKLEGAPPVNGAELLWDGAQVSEKGSRRAAESSEHRKQITADVEEKMIPNKEIGQPAKGGNDLPAMQ